MPADPARVDILNINVFDWDGQRAFAGGAERYVADLARLLSQLGMRPRLLQNAHFPFQREFEGFEVVGVAATREFDLAAMSAAFAPYVRDAALVIASPVELASHLDGGPPVIGVNHGIWWDLPGFRATYPHLGDHATLRAALGRVDACVAVDTNFINWLRASGETAPRLFYVPNYTDHARFRAAPKDFAAARLTALFPRRLCAERGFQVTMEAFESLWAQGVPCDLHLCGGGNATDEALAQGFVGKHPERARWTEAKAEDMPEVYAGSQIVVIPTLYSEGTSLACLEAMATNNGIVATYVGGLPDLIIDEVNGLLVEPGAAALAVAVRRLVDDRSLLAGLAARAREIGAAFTALRWQRRWAGVLKAVAPALQSALDEWLAELPLAAMVAPMRPEASAMADAELAGAQAALADALLGLRNARSERDGAYRAALAAAFDRDAALRAAGSMRRERDAAVAEGREATVAAQAHRLEAAADRRAFDREFTQARARYRTLADSRGVRLLRAIDRRGRFLLPAVDDWSGEASAGGTLPAGTAAAAAAAGRPVAPIPDAADLAGAPQAAAGSAAASTTQAPPPEADSSRASAPMRAECCGLVTGLASVVLPVYNQAALVGDAIRSVLAQTHRALELIIVDDGSTDGTPEVLSAFRSDPRVRVVTQANQRLPQALSNGFALARGEYWTWTSADNLMEARQLERMVERLVNAPEIGMVYADYRAIDLHGSPLVHWRAHNRSQPLSNVVHLPRTTERLNVIPDNFIGPCFLYRGWIGRVLGAYEPHQGVEDYDYWMRINDLFTIAHLGSDEPLYWYRVHDNTLTARKDEEGIPEKIDRLMALEQDRLQWYQRALTIHLDRALAGWRPTQGLSAYMLPIEDFATPPADADGPAVMVVAMARLAALATTPWVGDAMPLAVVVVGEAAIPDVAVEVLRRPRVLLVVDDARMAIRLRALTTAPLVDAESELLEAAIGGFARNASYAARGAK